MTESKSSSGEWFLGALTLVFITLKLTGVIAWSWWWVLAPMWIPMSIAFTLVILIVLAVMIAASRGRTLRGNIKFLGRNFEFNRN